MKVLLYGGVVTEFIALIWKNPSSIVNDSQCYIHLGLENT